MFISRIKELNWRYAVAEVTLIFVGITLALAFEEWANERQFREREARLLAELRVDLEESRMDLRRDIEAVQDRLQRLSIILSQVSGERAVDTEALGIHAAMLLNRATFFPKTSAYQSIRTIGLDLISDDDLRRTITELHELTIPRATHFLKDATSLASGQVAFEIRARFFLPEGKAEEARGRVQSVVNEIKIYKLSGLRPKHTEALVSDSAFQLLLYELFHRYSAALGAMLSLDQDISSALDELPPTEANGPQ